MVAEDFFAGPLLPAVARWRRAGLDAARLTVCGPCSGDATIAAPRANSSTARTADRLMTLIWSSALSLFWKALRHTPSAPHPTAERLPAARYSASSLHLGSCPAHRERRATWAGRPGRLVRGKPQPKPYSAPRAACHRTPGQPRQRAGGHAPQPAGPSDAARPNRTLSAAASNAAPTPTALEVRSP